MSKVQSENNRLQNQEIPAEAVQKRVLPNGEAAAALLAAGIGCLVFGLLTVLAEAIPSFSHVLLFYAPAGSISGLSTVMVVAWLVAWGILYALWKGKQVNFNVVFAISLVCILLGIVGICIPLV